MIHSLGNSKALKLFSQVNKQKKRLKCQKKAFIDRLYA